jgi:hypothetical protein
MTSPKSERYSQPEMSGLHPDKAFLVQFRNGSAAHAERLSGRIEHVKSGRTENFESRAELSKQLLKMLQEMEDLDLSEK